MTPPQSLGDATSIHSDEAGLEARPSRTPKWLEGLTALVLVGVMLALGWMIAAAYLPGAARLAALEVEVIVVLALLALALGLVSVVSLLHTRR